MANETKRREDVRLELDRRLFALCQVHQGADIPEYEPPFQLLITLIQIPHLDVLEDVRKRKGSDLSEVEKVHLQRRIASARYWLDHYAKDEDKFEVQAALPPSVSELSSVQRAFLHRLGEAFAGVPWTDEALQTLIFDVARQTPLPSSEAFEAIYIAFLDRRVGPRAGSLLACLPRDFVLGRLSEIPTQ